MSSSRRPQPGLRAVAGVLVTAATMVALAALSRVPIAVEPSEAAVIRLSWRTATAFVEECRTPSAQELERLPVHMRRERVCEGRLLPYRLHVVHDGTTVIDEWIHGAGARRDRPLSVFRELRVAPGEHDLLVRWLPDGFETHSADSDDEAHARPPALEFEARLTLPAHDVALITYDATRRSLVLRTPHHP